MKHADLTHRKAYAIAELVHVLPFSERLCYQLAAQGRLKTISLGRKRFVTREEVDRFLEELQEEAAV